MTDLHSIVYVRTATADMTTAQLGSLLTEARERNLACGVTGVLLYCNGTFMQCFEGAAPAMRATYERVRASRRHKDIIELMNEGVVARSFAGWQMGWLRLDKYELGTLSAADWHQSAQPSPGSVRPPLGLELLRNFWLKAQNHNSR